MTEDSRYTDMLAAGEGLLLAMRAEGVFSALYRKQPTPEALAKWVRARAEIDEQAKNYREARLSYKAAHRLR